MAARAIYSILSKKEDAHDAAIFTAAYTLADVGDNSKPKEFLVTGSLDCKVKVWKIENNKLDLLHTLKGHEMAVVSVAVSPDGQTIASTSLDATLIIWELLTGFKVHKIETKSTDVWKIAFSPDGLQVATSGHSGKVVIYGIVKGNEEKTLDTRARLALSIAWSSNSKYLSTGSVEGMVCIFDVSLGKLIHTFQAHKDAVRCVAFSPNSKLLATAAIDGKIHVYDVASGNLRSSFAITSWVVSVCFSRDGMRVATASADGCVRILHLAEMEVLHVFHEHTDVTWDVQFCADGKLISVSKDRSINVYECPIPKIEKK